jgi:thioesterase domain-containing protein
MPSARGHSGHTLGHVWSPPGAIVTSTPVRVVVVRAWSETADPRMMEFEGTLRALGIDVVDHYVRAAPTDRDMVAWARRAIEELAHTDVGARPTHVLGYCLGGHLLIEMLAVWATQGHRPVYAGLIDTWSRQPLFRLEQGIERRYEVSWPMRVRIQARAVSDPALLPWRRIARAWWQAARRGAALTCSPAAHVRQRRRRREQDNWWSVHLAYDWVWSILEVPLYLYNCTDSVANEFEGDPTLGLSAHLRGGYALRLVDGDHLSCLAGAEGVRLAALIQADLAGVDALRIDARRAGPGDPSR